MWWLLLYFSFFQQGNDTYTVLHIIDNIKLKLYFANLKLQIKSQYLSKKIAIRYFPQIAQPYHKPRPLAFSHVIADTCLHWTLASYHISSKYNPLYSLWRIQFKQLVVVTVKISEGPQCQEQADDLFLMVSRVRDLCLFRASDSILFCKWERVLGISKP